MSVPMRKNEPELEENLTTEDLAKASVPRRRKIELQTELQKIK